MARLPSLICICPWPGTDSIEMNGKTPMDVSGLGIKLSMTVFGGTEQKTSLYCVYLGNFNSSS